MFNLPHTQYSQLVLDFWIESVCVCEHCLFVSVYASVRRNGVQMIFNISPLTGDVVRNWKKDYTNKHKLRKKNRVSENTEISLPNTRTHTYTATQMSVFHAIVLPRTTPRGNEKAWWIFCQTHTHRCTKKHLSEWQMNLHKMPLVAFHLSNTCSLRQRWSWNIVERVKRALRTTWGNCFKSERTRVHSVPSASINKQSQRPDKQEGTERRRVILTE